MSRNSEIIRAGLSGRVDVLSSEGVNAPTIAEILSKESGAQFSKHMVHRYLQKTALNASVSPERNMAEMLVAALTGAPDVRDTADPNITHYGRYTVDTTNIFDRYYSVARDLSGQVERAFLNIALKVTNGALIVGDERDAEKLDALMVAIDFSSLLQDVVRTTCEMGTCVALLKSTQGEYMAPQITPTSYLTLLTDRETSGVVTTDLVHGAVSQIIHDEGSNHQIRYERDDVGLFRLWAGANRFTDLMGRPTFSIYGRSMTIGVETPLRSLLNSSYYYDEFVRRYGLGRLHINMNLLADMLRENTITPAAAQQTQDKEIAALQKIGANEDIVSTGREISMLESKTGFDIVPYLEWRRKQIDRALLQSDVAAGDVGSAWSSSGIAVSAQDYDSYKSLRETLFRLFLRDVITPYLPEFNLNPKDISISATPFLRVDVPYRDLIEMHDRDLISEGELRDRAGFSYAKPDDI